MTRPALEVVELVRAVRATDDLLGMCGFACVHKAKNPLKRRTFDQIVAQLSAELLEATYELDLVAAREMLQELDVDFAGLSASGRDQVFAAVEASLPNPALYQPLVLGVLAAALPALLLAAYGAAASRRGGAPSADDVALAERLRDGQARYAQVYMMDRNAHLLARVRALVDRSITDGWARGRLVEALHDVFDPEHVLARSAAYYDVVAGAFVGYTRTYGQLAAYRDAGIERWIFEAVLDEVTSDICRFMHGRVFTVQGALGVFDRIAGNLEAAKDSAPWLREGRNADGAKVLYTLSSDGHRREIATIVRSGFGARDDQGAYDTTYDSARLEAVGVCLPPLHGRCRSTVVADV
jgi:hypothetical protein